MSDFGQEVTLTVHTKVGDVIFKTNSLRVDFDVRLINGFSRATFEIYNLAESTIKSISAEDLYVTVRTKLHGKNEFVVANSFYISNVLDERKLPSNVTTLYCVDKLRKEVLEKPVEVIVKKPTLRKEIEAILDYAEFGGSVKYLMFPKGKIDQSIPAPSNIQEGSLQQCLRELQSTYKFNTYTDNGNLILMYKPDLDDVQFTELPGKIPDVILEVKNMRANPKIGVATLNITSNLDGRIKPSAVVDTTKLLTAGTDTDEKTLQFANQFLKKSVAGFTKYQVLAVQHKGSNYSDLWQTVATCTSPTKGLTIPALTWFK